MQTVCVNSPWVIVLLAFCVAYTAIDLLLGFFRVRR
jgi:hypothetical protein